MIFFLFLMKEQMCVWARVAANRKPWLVQGTCTSQCSNTARAWWMFLDHLRTLDNISHLCHSASCRHCRPRMACSSSKVSKRTKLQLPAATCSYLQPPAATYINRTSEVATPKPYPTQDLAMQPWPGRFGSIRLTSGPSCHGVTSVACALLWSRRQEPILIHLSANERNLWEDWRGNTHTLYYAIIFLNLFTHTHIYIYNDI